MGAADEEKSPETGRDSEVTPRPELLHDCSKRKPSSLGDQQLAVIASNASKELEALVAHMPHIPDADARKLALRMYYLELSEGVLLKDACPNVSREKVFLLPQCVAGNHSC